jgi:predicted amidohydrolase YtcJ
MRLANRYGVTATNDMMPGYGYDCGHFETYAGMAQEKILTMRIHAAPSLFSDLNSITEKAVKYHSDHYQIKLLKQFVDGVPTTYTALMLEPYADNPETSGKTLNDLDQLETAILKAHQNGFSVHLHCCGDGAVRFALDSFEKAIEKYGATGSRHSIEHVETTTPEDIERFARLGVIASMQPEHLVSPKGFENNEYLSRFNERQKRYSWAFRSMLDAGVHVAFGSDCPIVSIDPFAGLYRAVTRLQDDHQPDGGWNPEQKLTIEEAIDSYTLQGAYTVHRENELGTLETGKLADFIVLDQNLLAINPEEIRKTKVLETIVGGSVVFSADRKWE